jgi:prolyl-tRNA editing enzyme YbaK/EbsC (Cys-tRNA(Pro) deacylase)
VPAAPFRRSASATVSKPFVDDAIEGQGEVYLEAGDHATLVHLSHAQFAKLTADARHGRFSMHV